MTTLLLAAPPVAAQDAPSVAPPAMQAVAPALADYTDEVLFGDVWLRPQLSPRDRSLVVLSVLIATGRAAQLPGHLRRGLNNGLRPLEISGLVTHLAFYAGWPDAVSALPAIEEAFGERGVDLAALRVAARSSGPRSGRRADPGVAPADKLAELDQRVLEADLWQRTDLSRRDRALATVAAFAARGEQAALPAAIARARAAGLDEDALAEAFTHIAFYAGWPRATTALRALDTPAGPGAAGATAPAANFTGRVAVSAPIAAGPLGGATVRFAPGARTHWHSHPGGQLLVVTAGRGWVRTEGAPARAVGPGDVVWTPPGVAHWHGAAADTEMTHVALSRPLEGVSVHWASPVHDTEYRAAGAGPADAR